MPGAPDSILGFALEALDGMISLDEKEMAKKRKQEYYGAKFERMRQQILKKERERKRIWGDKFPFVLGQLPVRKTTNKKVSKGAKAKKPRNGQGASRTTGGMPRTTKKASKPHQRRSKPLQTDPTGPK